MRSGQGSDVFFRHQWVHADQRIKMPGAGIEAANPVGRQHGTQLAGCLCAGLRQSFHRWFPQRQPWPHGERRLGSNSVL